MNSTSNTAFALAEENGEAISALAAINEIFNQETNACLVRTLGEWKNWLIDEGHSQDWVLPLFQEILRLHSIGDSSTPDLLTSLSDERSLNDVIAQLHKESPQALNDMFNHLDLASELQDELMNSSGGSGRTRLAASRNTLATAHFNLARKERFADEILGKEIFVQHHNKQSLESQQDSAKESSNVGASSAYPQKNKTLGYLDHDEDAVRYYDLNNQQRFLNAQDNQFNKLNAYTNERITYDEEHGLASNVNDIVIQQGKELKQESEIIKAEEVEYEKIKDLNIKQMNRKIVNETPLYNWEKKNGDVHAGNYDSAWLSGWVPVPWIIMPYEHEARKIKKEEFALAAKLNDKYIDWAYANGLPRKGGSKNTPIEPFGYDELKKLEWRIYRGEVYCYNVVLDQLYSIASSSPYLKEYEGFLGPDPNGNGPAGPIQPT